MSLTLVQAETLLIARTGKRMAFVGMNSTTVDGTNSDLIEPIVTALFALDITPADISAPSNDDLAKVESIPEFLDRAELRVMQNIVGNMDMVDISEGPRSESLSQFTSALEKAIERKQAKVDAEYGGSLGGLSAGVFSHNFAQKADD
jgi:hypothetical protein